MEPEKVLHFCFVLYACKIAQVSFLFSFPSLCFVLSLSLSLWHLSLTSRILYFLGFNLLSLILPFSWAHFCILLSVFWSLFLSSLLSLELTLRSLCVCFSEKEKEKTENRAYENRALSLLCSALYVYKYEGDGRMCCCENYIFSICAWHDLDWVIVKEEESVDGGRWMKTEHRNIRIS